MVIAPQRSGVGDHQPQCRHQGHQADQLVAQEGSSKGLRDGALNEAGIHPSANHLAHHEGSPMRSKGRRTRSGFRLGGSLIVYDSLLNLTISDTLSPL